MAAALRCVSSSDLHFHNRRVAALRSAVCAAALGGVLRRGLGVETAADPSYSGRRVGHSVLLF